MDINQEPKYKNIVEIPFASEINKREFNKYFLYGINFARTNYDQKSLRILKRILLMLINNQQNEIGDEFGIASNKNILNQTYKIDLIFTLLTNENKIKNLKIKDIEKTEEVFKETDNYLLLNYSDSFKDILPYNKNIKEKYSIDNFEKILYSPVIINTYRDLLFDLYNMTITTELIKKKLKDFLKRFCIYFVLMDPKVNGMVLYNGTIIINRILIHTYRKEGRFKLFFTLLHELMYVLSRLFIDDPNFFVNKDEFLKKDGMKIIGESGEYFDKRLLLDSLPKPEITDIEAEYLLEPKNYKFKNAEEFKLNFIDFRKKKMKSILNLEPFHIGKSPETYTFTIGQRCYLCFPSVLPPSCPCSI